MSGQFCHQVAPAHDTALEPANGYGTQHRAESRCAVPVTREDIAFLQYTGGTTGVAKGAILTQGNMVANVKQTWGYWIIMVSKAHIA